LIGLNKTKAVAVYRYRLQFYKEKHRQEGNFYPKIQKIWLD